MTSTKCVHVKAVLTDLVLGVSIFLNNGYSSAGHVTGLLQLGLKKTDVTNVDGCLR